MNLEQRVKALLEQRTSQDQLYKSFEVDAKTIKQLEETGTATARIAVIGVKDHDGDIMALGSFIEGQVITILPTHQWQEQPLGKGMIRMDGNDVLVDMKFNLESQAAREWHKWLKFDLEVMTPIQEWSWGWDWKNLEFTEVRDDGEAARLFTKIPVIEASPVLRGAGTNTGTVAVKSLKHTTATSNALWSRSDNVKNLVEGDPQYGNPFATDDKKFLHHFIDPDDGRAREASVKACEDGIEVLNGIRGGATVPDEAKQAVYDHLAQHLKDAGVDPAELKVANSGMKFADEVNDVVQMAYDLQDAVSDLGVRFEGVKALRQRSGRKLSTRKIEEINTVIKALQDLEGINIEDDEAINEQVLNLKAQAIRNGLTKP